MRFLFPGFLFSLLAIAIPIIIHLFNFRKFRKVYFSNVRFLKSVEEQTASRQHLKNLLILAARILAIMFLVFAFARPYIANNDLKASSKEVVSIYIDNSYSMEGVNREGSLLDEARRRAKEIAAAYSRNDKFQLLTNDFEGKHQRLLNQEDFLKAVDEVKISAGNKDLAQIISRQQDIFVNEPGARKSIYLISDFQKNVLPSGKLPADSSVSLHFVRVRSNPLPNISIDSVWFISAINKPGEAGRLVARLRNNSAAEAVNIPVKLLVDGQQRAIGNLDIPPRASKTDTLSFSGLKAGWKSGEISITDYPVIFDDRFFFSFNVSSKLPVMAINGSGINPYLQAVYKSDPYFVLENTPEGNINYSRLGEYPLIILNEASEFSSGLIQQLKLYTEKGGSLLILPSLNEDQTSLRQLLAVLRTDIPQRVVTADIRVASINLQHPVFKGVFETIPQKMDLPAVKKYLSYSAQSRTNKRTLMSLPGRDEFLSEYRLGKGRIYLSAVPLNDEAGNFARHSLFVPVMYKIAMLSLQPQRLYFTLGDDQIVEIPRTTLNPNQTLTLRKGKFEAIPDLRQTAAGTQIYVADQLKETGNYELLKGDSLLSYLAFNQKGDESDLTYATDEELLSRLPKGQLSIINSTEGAIRNSISSSAIGLQLWKLCIILALVFLAIEVLLLRFYKVKSAKALS